MMPLKVHAPFEPMGDQITAIEKLSEGFLNGNKFQTLLGVTGSGKTFVSSHIIERVGLPTLVIAHNKTLAAQLYAEYREFFPEAKVEYFVSFYDYYQPEAYLPTKDLYISKDFSINEQIEKLRNSTTRSLAERDDVIVVATVSAIYGVGIPEVYRSMALDLHVGMEMERDQLLRKLVELQYRRNEYELKPKTFRAKGDIVELFPIYQDETIQIEFFGDEIERITLKDPKTGHKLAELDEVRIFPGAQYLTQQQALERGIRSIREELNQRYEELLSMGKIAEAQRLLQRTNYDLEQLEEFGYCSGIENYSLHFEGRSPGDPPFTLIDHFPKDFLLIIDESHVTIPQLRGMYGGDFSRKKSLVNYGFRLPTAYDNRPLRFEEFERRMPYTLFMSATPGDYELQKSQLVVEQIIRPTGLTEPEIDVRKTENQIDDVINEIQKRVQKGQRTLVTTLTKRMAEQLAEYLLDMGIKASHLHSDVDSLERVQILQDLRKGEIDVIVGINLLREGLDLPEVTLVAILDADKEGFLRSKRSLIQTMGRAARNVEGKVILYADKITDNMRQAIDEVNRRRRIQIRYNKEHNITPKTVVKGLKSVLDDIEELKTTKVELPNVDEMKTEDVNVLIEELTIQMNQAAEKLEFELAAQLRDKIKDLKRMLAVEV
ncbi:MAG: excinuclease ABC subunit UvrB [Methanobacteriota archaeon]|nr:MAG: excinuclease ABC subunit UvrB [Euryarchaeota archaeon]